MKKRMLLISGCTMLLSLSTSAYGAAEMPFYVSGNLGWANLSDAEVSNSNPAISNMDIESHEGYALGAALGYDFGDTRIEGELAYQNNSLDKASNASGDVDLDDNIDSLAFLVNGYWDFTNNTPWTSFVSVGIGAALVNVDDNTAYLGDDYDTVFAYQVGAGVGYAVNELLTVECKYRYLATSDPEFDKVDTEYATHNIYAGMRFAFSAL